MEARNSCSAVTTESMESETLGALGVTVAQLAIEKLGWIFRRHPERDHGIDAHFEPVVGGRPTGRLVALQIKTGSTYFREALRDGSGWTVRFEERHHAYWTGHSLPVAIVIVNEAQEAFWESVSHESVANTGIGWKLEVPHAQRLDQTTADALRALADLGSAAQARHRRLAIDHGLMQLADAGRLRLEIAEWVHEGSGYGRFALVRLDEDAEVQLQDWREIAEAPWSSSNRRHRLFPWASLRMEAGTTSILDVDALAADTPSSEGDEITELYRPFNALRSEMVGYRMQVELNELGRAFLTVEAHLRGPDAEPEG